MYIERANLEMGSIKKEKWHLSQKRKIKKLVRPSYFAGFMMKGFRGCW